jgi:integrase
MAKRFLSGELEALVEATENPRDRALLLCHYESGCRIGELLTLKIESIRFDKYGALLIVNGKTGAKKSAGRMHRSKNG